MRYVKDQQFIPLHSNVSFTFAITYFCLSRVLFSSKLLFCIWFHTATLNHGMEDRQNKTQNTNHLVNDQNRFNFSTSEYIDEDSITLSKQLFEKMSF